MKNYVIINAKKMPSVIDVPDAQVFQTQYAGHADTLIRDILRESPECNLHIYGGDGSVFEAVNAVMASGCADTATVIIHPFGTGNDFVRNFSESDLRIRDNIDLIQFNDKYAANEINVGFDCDVVVMTKKMKRVVKGSAAYLVSALLTLFKPMGRMIDITVTDEHGNEETINEKLLLCLIANGGYYGGGFNCAPLASLNDGLMDFIYVKKISRFKFLRFFMGYRNGKHFLPDGSVNPKYKSFFSFKRITSATIRNVGDVCADGELFNYETLNISVKKQAIYIQAEAKAK